MADDLDLRLGSEVALPQTQALIADGGARALNYFVSTPRCTPSRSAFLTGRHYHNLRKGGQTSGTSLNATSLFDEDALFPTMRRAGYKTALFGKIHNGQGTWLCTPKNHTEPFDHIETECHPCGGYYRTAANDWVTKQTHDAPLVFSSYEPQFSNYSEAQYGNRTARWIRGLHAAEPDTPWLAYIGTTGPHLSSIPAWWHRSAVMEMKAAGVRAPRTPNFNYHAADHFHMFATQPALDEHAIAVVDQHYRDRLGTLLSIDDMVAGVVATLRELGILSRTFVMFTSDHGYHLGQNRIPLEKIEPYDTDIRVPFYFSGPGIAAGTTIPQLVSNIDIAPTVGSSNTTGALFTLADIAGLSPPNLMDGRSLLPLVVDPAAAAGLSLGGGLGGGGGGGGGLERIARGARQIDDGTAPWRTHFIVEFSQAKDSYFGQVAPWNGTAFSDAHAGGPFGPVWCNGTDSSGAQVCHAPRSLEQCHPTWPNGTRGDYKFCTADFNWRALRVINSTDDFMFVQVDGTYVFDPSTIDTLWAEFYDLRNDSWQMHNLWRGLPATRKRALQREIAALAACGGTRAVRSNCTGGYLPPAPAPAPEPAPAPAPAPAPIMPARWMPETNVNGTSEQRPCKAVAYSDAHKCGDECDGDGKCAAWMFHFTKAGSKGEATWRCCLRTEWTNLVRAKGCTSGIKSP